MDQDKKIEKQAIAFAEWVEDRYTRVGSKKLNKTAWVNYHENTVYLQGSEAHFESMILLAGKTTKEIYDEFLKEVK